MSTYRFAGLPSNSSVVAGVTFAVSAWFLVAGALMLTETPEAPPAVQPRATAVMYSAPAVAISPEARLLIVVEARRA